MRLSALFVIPMLLILAACQPAGPVAPAGLTDADRDAIHALGQAWADGAKANDWAAVAALYSADGILMPPNAPAVEGRQNIQDFLAAFPAVTDMQLEDVDVDGCGDLAYVRGVYSMTMTVGEAPVTDTGKYVTILKKQADGSWSMYRDIYNSDVPLPASPQPENP